MENDNINCYLTLKNEELWLKHLEKVKLDNGNIEDALNFNFEFDLLPFDSH